MQSCQPACQTRKLSLGTHQATDADLASSPSASIVAALSLMMNQQKKTRHDSDEYGDNNNELKNVAEFARPPAKVEEFAIVTLDHLTLPSLLRTTLADFLRANTPGLAPPATHPHRRRLGHLIRISQQSSIACPDRCGTNWCPSTRTANSACMGGLDL